MDLPDEILRQIFDIAADEDVIFQYGLPTAMAESAWYKDVTGSWRLRSPKKAVSLIQMRSYSTKKAIISTCPLWRRLGSELLFRCLYFDKPSKLIALCKTIDTPSSHATTTTHSLGWWTRRIHVSGYCAIPELGITMDDLETALVTIIRHCPNLEIFIVDSPMGDTFGTVADTLAMYAKKSLRTVHWSVPCDAMHKAIWALDSLPYLLAAHINFDKPVSDQQECVILGAASDVHLHLPNLQQLSLTGYLTEFLDQAMGWSIPALKSLTIDTGLTCNDLPDVVGFLHEHGLQLIYLDLNCAPAVPIMNVLGLCPMLNVFAFNADWRIMPHSDTASELVNRPHTNITTIGLHGLRYAFGVGYKIGYAAGEPLGPHITRRSNDLNVAALTKLNFPKLQCVRALSESMLDDLNEADGPAKEDGGWDRWDRWWSMFEKVGVRLEDCTGALLGTLPQNEDDEEEDSSDEESEEGEEEEEDDEDEWPFSVPPVPREDRSEHVTELRQLLEECRAMDEGREESMFSSMFGGMGMMGPSGMGMMGPGMGMMGPMPGMGFGGMNPAIGYPGMKSDTPDFAAIGAAFLQRRTSSRTAPSTSGLRELGPGESTTPGPSSSAS
ncbi:hypothetical protein BDQ12DRAFT_740130 [Crucibulum laeve]|uniref:F-box domain-containing protein n=1 Tax=Crucibulum laeve TaxID=68775 RepID=A0A5C3LDR5_9AGAR|nr:hypothetical protein BDQ12DRAFT_740130 [Crucibulum laeve]